MAFAIKWAPSPKCSVVLWFPCWFTPMFILLGETLPRKLAISWGFASLVFGTFHSPVLVYFYLPSQLFPCLYVTITPIVLKVTLHPALNSVMTDISEYNDIPGIVFPVRAACGSCGR